MNKIPVAILGATGMVGQRFISLLSQHPWFEITCLAASPQSAGKTYAAAVEGRWVSKESIPQNVSTLIMLDAEKDALKISKLVKLAFSAVDLSKEAIQKLEEHYAALGCVVVSNNSAHRWTPDVPMLIPEINHTHTDLLHTQRKNRGWSTGCIAVKPNCSIQSYVPILECWRPFGIEKVRVTTLQAISGAGKTFASWPEMVDNVIPLIKGEEEKSEKEPLKIWGTITLSGIELAQDITISATCIRVPVSDGHMASVSVSFKNKPSISALREQIENYRSEIAEYNLPSAPKKLVHYFEQEDRPQTGLDRDCEHGMAISLGRIREDTIFDYTCIGLSHNTLRGAAGGAVLMAELLVAKGFC